MAAFLLPCAHASLGVYFTGVSAMGVFVEHFGTPKADGTGYEIKASDLSVMTSMINVGELVGSLTAAPLNDFLGRKGVFLIGALTVIVGVVLQLSTDHSHAYIIGGRVILGYGVGAFSSTSPLYIGVRAFLFGLFFFYFWPSSSRFLIHAKNFLRLGTFRFQRAAFLVGACGFRCPPSGHSFRHKLPTTLYILQVEK